MCGFFGFFFFNLSLFLFSVFICLLVVCLFASLLIFCLFVFVFLFFLARHLVTKGSYSRKDYILNGNERYCINNESLNTVSHDLHYLSIGVITGRIYTCRYQ